VLTMVGGKVVYASGGFSKHAPPPLPVSPDWSPIKHYGGYQQQQESRVGAATRAARSTIEPEADHKHRWVLGEAGMWSLGCDCFAF
jgi:hypothetical protein